MAYAYHAEKFSALQSGGGAPASGRACCVRARDTTMVAAAGMHCMHAIRGACRVSRGKRGRGGAYPYTDRGRWPRQLFLTYRKERKELCQIRWSIDREQETAGIGVVS